MEKKYNLLSKKRNTKNIKKEVIDFKIKKMTVKDSREIKNEIELLAKKANAESQNWE
jgi:hypothetical protein